MRYKVSHVRHVSGFSMMEMMVVMAILLTLMAIILPAFHAARERAKLAICQSNLAQMGRSTQNYASEWFGAYMPFGQFEQNFGRDVIICPRDSEPFELLAAFTLSGVDMPISYGVNREMIAFRMQQARVSPASQVGVYFDGAPAYQENKANKKAKGGADKVNMIHIPPGNNQNPQNILPDDDSVPAHLAHGCLLGALDANGKDVGASSAATFDPRHPIQEGIGNIIFADWHIEFVDTIEEHNFMFPGGGGFPTGGPGNGNGNN